MQERLGETLCGKFDRRSTEIFMAQAAMAQFFTQTSRLNKNKKDHKRIMLFFLGFYDKKYEL